MKTYEGFVGNFSAYVDEKPMIISCLTPENYMLQKFRYYMDEPIEQDKIITLINSDLYKEDVVPNGFKAMYTKSLLPILQSSKFKLMVVPPNVINELCFAKFDAFKEREDKTLDQQEEEFFQKFVKYYKPESPVAAGTSPITYQAEIEVPDFGTILPGPVTIVGGDVIEMPAVEQGWVPPPNPQNMDIHDYQRIMDEIAQIGRERETSPARDLSSLENAMEAAERSPQSPPETASQTFERLIREGEALNAADMRGFDNAHVMPERPYTISDRPISVQIPPPYTQEYVYRPTSEEIPDSGEIEQEVP